MDSPKKNYWLHLVYYELRKRRVSSAGLAETANQRGTPPDSQTIPAGGVASLAVDTFVNYGGWTARNGKQYDIGVTTSQTTCNATGTKGLGEKVDLDYFAATMF
jgi:hypothetical protein